MTGQAVSNRPSCYFICTCVVGRRSTPITPPVDTLTRGVLSFLLPSVGARVTDHPATSRRLAAILAADVVGYSSLMERDEIATLGRLKARRSTLLSPLVARYAGRIVKLMGDGVLV